LVATVESATTRYLHEWKEPVSVTATITTVDRLKKYKSMMPFFDVKPKGRLRSTRKVNFLIAPASNAEIRKKHLLYL